MHRIFAAPGIRLAVRPVSPDAPDPAFTRVDSVLLLLGLSSGLLLASWSLAWSIPMLPYIAGAYSTSLDHAIWSLTFYLLAWALAVVPATWLYQRFGELRMFQISLTLLMVATLPDVFSDHFGLFLGGRFLQGTAAGFLTPLTRRLLIRYAPLRWQKTAADLSIVNLVLPLLAGPSLAGWIAYTWDWRAAAVLTFPVGLLALGMVSALLRDDPGEHLRQPFDWIGLLLLAAWSATFQIVLNRGEDWNWWDAPAIRWLTALGAVLLVAFFLWERDQPHPCLDLRLLRRRNYVLALPALVFGWGLLLGGNSLFVSALISHANYSAFWAGVVLLPMALGGVPLIAVMGPVSHRVNPRWLATICFGFVAIYGFTTRLNLHSNLRSLLLSHLIEGIAIGFYLVPLSLIMFSRLPQSRLPAAATLQNFVRILGGAYLSSAFSALWMRHGDTFRAHLAWQSPTLPLQSLLEHWPVSGPAAQALSIQHLTTQSAALSMQSMLWLWGWMALAVLALVWLTKGPYRRRAGQVRRVTIEQQIMESAGFDAEPGRQEDVEHAP
ncbi:MAG: MFS transporter [Gammaproteobacteria bacterium]|nr:MFS transporter [Gammaproteobacteria bacterium]